MAIFMKVKLFKVIGRMIRRMDLEDISIKMEINTKENGWMIFNMGKDLKLGLKDQDIMENTIKGTNMEMGLTFGKMDQITKEIGETIC